MIDPVEQVATILDPSGKLLAAINEPDEAALGTYEPEWDDDGYDHMAEKDNDARRYENRHGGDDL